MIYFLNYLVLGIYISYFFYGGRNKILVLINLGRETWNRKHHLVRNYLIIHKFVTITYKMKKSKKHKTKDKTKKKDTRDISIKEKTLSLCIHGCIEC